LYHCILKNLPREWLLSGGGGLITLSQI